MLNKGDKVSVLDEAINGVVLSVKNNEVAIETEDGFTMTFFVNELIKIQDSSNLMNSIKRINVSEITKEKEEPKARSFVKERKDKREIPAPEFDLHIEKLVPNKHGMSNYDILTLQTETAKRHIEFAIRNRIPKIVFIHGVGEGILKAELDFLLGRYDGINFQDANYQKYGLGATEVYFVQNAK
ncbi:Smr/MutS family protein [Flavobacterium hydatis]|uniref:DNA mismatch repair protein MutS n=1 Tax=Flavobacterium hydatis TaxID=991 RepID=A0A086AJ43_FLAHY|nr:Smr/MutS family protein [Flavobacterium hydatis]KFF16707.1 DNA mismatch repair protein MutS [Flavobacterium hydatis]OXA95379.1 DNA mismatch repair protein MutS [Flavobacterium hydatis]